MWRSTIRPEVTRGHQRSPGVTWGPLHLYLPLGSSSILLDLPCLGGGGRSGALARGWADLGHLGGGGRRSSDFTSRVKNNTHTQTQTQTHVQKNLPSQFLRLRQKNM